MKIFGVLTDWNSLLRCVKHESLGTVSCLVGIYIPVPICRCCFFSLFPIGHTCKWQKIMRCIYICIKHVPKKKTHIVTTFWVDSNWLKLTQKHTVARTERRKATGRPCGPITWSGSSSRRRQRWGELDLLTARCLKKLKFHFQVSEVVQIFMVVWTFGVGVVCSCFLVVLHRICS